MKNRLFYKSVIVFLAAVFVLSSFIIPISALDSANDESFSLHEVSNQHSYSSYIKGFDKIPYGEQDIVLGSEIKLVSGNTHSFVIETSKTGVYELKMDYICLKAQDMVLTVSIDGKIPFAEAERLTFPAFWENSGKYREDKNGNHFAPEQVLFTEEVTSTARDYSGKYEDPYLFLLEEGRHTVDINVYQGEAKLKNLTFTKADTYKPYNEKNIKLSGSSVVIEGEAAVLKNRRSLVALSDRSSCVISPSDPQKNLLNYIGGSNWSSAGSALTWEFDIEKSGFYSVDFLYRQNGVLNGVVYRTLAIDGTIPFEEAKRVKFKYGRNWQNGFLAADDKRCYIYLEKGTHTLTLTVTAGPLSEIYDSLQVITEKMGDMYREITMIVGETVDLNRSYELFNQIPDFNKRLDEIIDGLEDTVKLLEKLQEVDSGSNVSLIKNAIRVVRYMIDNPYSAHRYKSNFYDSYANINALMSDMTNMPLDIDRIVLSGKETDSFEKVSFIEKMLFSAKRFLATFLANYSTYSPDGENEEALTLWVSWGRDQAQVLNHLIQESFVSKEGIDVEVSIVNASLIQGILSGNGPDVLLQMARTDPMNYAMRGALYDLSSFKDVDEVTERFTQTATLPYRYNGGLYALPDTQNFFVMFLRTDILDSLGIKAPETWDEFIEAAILLQRKNLQVYLPYTQITDSGTVNTGVGGLSIFPTLLVQRNLPIYNDEQTATTLAQTEQIKVFNEWVGWHTKYNIPEVMDFYNRFKTGSAPIGITTFTLYTQIKAAAPEIDGRWTVAMIPGTKKDDGTVNHSSAGSGTGCAITKLSKNPENAWKFLKWWTNADTQLKYSTNLESVLGPLGRVSVSNTAAFKGMDWDAQMFDIMLKQRNEIVEIPEIPGGYYTARGIDQAFWGVNEQGYVPLEMITKWGAVVDGEIARKRAEYID